MNLPAPFSKNQDAFFWRCFNSWLNVAEGGKRGGKNVLITMAYCSILEKHPSKIHLIAGVSTSTARLNILDCDGYGMTNFFEGRCRLGQYQNRDCLYVNTPTGEKIVLVSGGGKDRDERLIKGNTYGTAYITEANECHPNFIQEVFDRTISSPDRKVFHDLNPKNPEHWYYNILDFHEKQQAVEPSYGYNYGHFTIADNMSISDAQLRSVLKTYNKDSVWYKRDILGQRCIADGLVYPMFRDSMVVDVIPWQALQRGTWYISVDYGTVNPTAAGLWCLWKGTAYRVSEYYYDSRKPGNHQKTDEEHYAALEDLAGDHKIEVVVVDPSAASFKATIRRHGRFPAWGADNSVLNGIRLTADLLQAGRILIHKDCKALISEIASYRWDMEADCGEDAVVKENDHACDDMRYFCATIMEREVRGNGI